MTQPRLKDLLNKFTGGKLDRQEKDELKTLLASCEDKISNSSDDKWMNEFNIERARTFLHNRIRKFDPHFRSETTVSRAPQLSWYWGVAASIALVTAFAFFFIKERNRNADLAWREVHSKPGQHVKVVLPDKSVVLLNGGTTITFPKTFSEELREVHINGEGYFKVTKDQQRPFIVHLQDYRVTVLGTTFNVNAYEEDTAIEVALLEGAVQVGHKDAGDATQLKPNSKIELDKRTAFKRVTPIDSVKTIGWMNRLLVFKNDPMVEVIQQLEKTYGMTFRYEESHFVDCRVNAEFRNENIWTVLEALQYATGITYTVNPENEVVLEGTGCINKN